MFILESMGRAAFGGVSVPEPQLISWKICSLCCLPLPPCLSCELQLCLRPKWVISHHSCSHKSSDTVGGVGAPTAIQMLTALADSTERSHTAVTPLAVWCLVGRAASGGCFACSFSWIFLQTYPSSTPHPPASCRTGRTCSYHLYPQCGWRKQTERTKDASLPWCDLLLPLIPSLVRLEAQSLGGALASSPFILFRFPCQSLLMVLIDFAVSALEPEYSQVRVLWTAC